MTEAAWLSLTRLDAMMTLAFGLKAPLRREGLFACGCLRCAADWRLPDAEADAVEATERFLDGDMTRPTWQKRRRAIEAKDTRWERTATQWDRDFRAAAVSLFYPSPGWSVSNRLLHSVRAISSEGYSAAFEAKLCNILRDVVGTHVRPVVFRPEWRTDTAMALARQMCELRDFSAMPILADALQDAGCDSDAVLNHCRDTSLTHVRGCWVCDLVLGKT